MKKKYPNKMMTADKEETKSGTLICQADRFVPGFGNFTKGQEVTDPATISHLTANGEHPDFKPKEA